MNLSPAEFARTWERQHVPPEQTYIAAFYQTDEDAERDAEPLFRADVVDVPSMYLRMEVRCECGRGCKDGEPCRHARRYITRWRYKTRLRTQGRTLYFEPVYVFHDEERA